MHSISESEYLVSCCDIARGAGQIIMQYFSGKFDTRHKDDKSPVTDADIAANAHITEALSRLTPHIPIVAEEDEALTELQHELFWLVDPLDGTRSFVRGETEFTVNIGLIGDRKPLLGVLYAPPQELLYFGGINSGAFRQQGNGQPEAIHARKAREQVIVTRSKSHPSKATQAYLEKLMVGDIIPCSSAIKFGMVAEGSADLYPRFGRTMEWDTAAGHAILNAAGGRVETVDGQPLEYGKPGFENPGFIAYGR